MAIKGLYFGKVSKMHIYHFHYLSIRELLWEHKVALIYTCCTGLEVKYAIEIGILKRMYFFLNLCLCLLGDKLDISVK